LKLVLDRVKPHDQMNNQASKIIINGFVLKNASLAANNYLDESNLHQFECKLPACYFIVSKKNYKYPIEVKKNMLIYLKNRDFRKEKSVYRLNFLR